MAVALPLPKPPASWTSATPGPTPSSPPNGARRAPTPSPSACASWRALTLAVGIGGYFVADTASDVTRLGYLLAGVLFFALFLGGSFAAKRWRR